jgi:hypothetical protein
MTEERLKEIKDSIDFQKEILIAHNMETFWVDEELELYNEVVRLREIIKEATKEYWDGFKEDDLTLEQLNGIENE